MSAPTQKGKSKEKEPRKRPVNTDFYTLQCPGGWKQMCEGLEDWGKAWEKWGNSVLAELDEIKLAVCHLEQNVYYGATWDQGIICNKDGKIVRNGGTPPTNSTQPPPPPFKP